MPFLVTDSIDVREHRIHEFLKDGEPVIAVLLAAADCERTIRRAIIALSTAPTATVKKRIGKDHGSLSRYPGAWKKYVFPVWEAALDGDVIKSFDDLKKAFKLRHSLVHGEQGTTSSRYAAKCIETMLYATRAVDEFSKAHGFDLTQRIKTRMRPRKRGAKR